MYCTVDDIRKEGVTDQEASDDRIKEQIEYWSQFIDEITGQWFEAREAEFIYFGNGLDILFFQVPPISITEIKFDNVTQLLTNFYVNKNLDNPFLRSKNGTFPYRSEIKIKGNFGYLIRDKTPLAIKRATIKSVLNSIAPMREQEITGAGQILSESTDGHRITYMRPRNYRVTKLGGMVVDVEVKNLIEQYIRTPIVDCIGRHYALSPITTPA